MKISVKLEVSEHGVVAIILTEPWASHQANMEGLRRARNNATYKGCRFGRKLQSELSHAPLRLTALPNYPEIYAARGGIVEVANEVLADIVSKSERINELLAGAEPAKATYQCAEPGCHAIVRAHGDYCSQCEFDR